MRLDSLTRHAFTVMMSRLLLGYQRHVADDDLEPTIDVYFGIVQRFPEPIVDQAVGDLLSHPTRYFPRAGDLAAKCREIEGEAIRRQASQSQTTDHDDRCPDCRTGFSYAGYELGNGNVVGRRRCQCPPMGRGWFTEAARAWRDTGPTDRVSAMAELRRVLRPSKAAAKMETIQAVLGDRGDAWEPTDEEIDARREAFRTAAQTGLR